MQINWVSLALAVIVELGASAEHATAAAAASGTPAVAPSSPVAVLELQAGTAIRYEPVAAAGLDVETKPFISRAVSLRIGGSYVASSSFRGANATQLGARVQVAAGWKRFELAVGLIGLQHSDAYDSGHFNADLSADIAFTAHWRLRAEHWSNAGSSYPNIGRNMALICYRF